MTPLVAQSLLLSYIKEETSSTLDIGGLTIAEAVEIAFDLNLPEKYGTALLAVDILAFCSSRAILPVCKGLLCCAVECQSLTTAFDKTHLIQEYFRQ